MVLRPSDATGEDQPLADDGVGLFAVERPGRDPAVLLGGHPLRLALLLGLPPCDIQDYLVKPLQHALVLGVDDRHDRILRADGESDAPAGEPGQAGSPVRLQGGLQDT